jgi:opacity protein-like surface antigen
MSRKIVFLLAAVVVVLAMVPVAEAKEGFYAGLGITYNTIEGDFNGSGDLRRDNELIIIPDIDNALGIDILGGYGINDRWSIELNLMSSGHRGAWGGVRKDVNYTSFSVNGKYSILSSGMTQPYLLFGISGNALRIKNGGENTLTGEIGDATLSGPGLNVGVGIDEYFTQHVSVDLGVMYRYVEYTDASGVDDSGRIDDRLNGSGFSFLLTAGYHF